MPARNAGQAGLYHFLAEPGTGETPAIFGRIAASFTTSAHGLTFISRMNNTTSMSKRSSASLLLQRYFSRTVVAAVALLSISAMPVMHGKDAVRLPVEESINLPKMTVKGTPVCSFGIGVVCTRDLTTRKIKRIFISEVLSGSLADQDGLKEGDEILAINGRKVAGVQGDIKPGAWLFDQLADRAPGESIEVEVAVRVFKKVKLRAFRPAETMPPK